MIIDRDPGDETEYETITLDELFVALEDLDPCSMGIAPSDVGDETDAECKHFPRAAIGLEAKASALVALIGTVGTVSQAALERVIREQAQMQSDHRGV